MSDILLERGLPSNLDAERLILGVILLEGQQQFELILGALQTDDFSIEKNRRIFARMNDLYARGEGIDRITVANELDSRGELKSVDGLSYLVSLDDGLPATFNIDGYVRIVKEKSTLRRTIFAAQNLIDRCMGGMDGAGPVLADAEAVLARLADSQ